MTFSQGSVVGDMMCVDLAIANDAIVEGTETIVINAVSLDPFTDIQAGGNQAMIFIFDDDFNLNDCALNNGGCEQVCIDNELLCSCDRGFRLADDGISCTDIDECTSQQHQCQHVCNNTIGSFQCSCNGGFTLSSDGLSCSDDDECTENTHTCQQICVNTIGSFTCECNQGFELDNNLQNCSSMCSYIL